MKRKRRLKGKEEKKTEVERRRKRKWRLKGEGTRELYIQPKQKGDCIGNQHLLNEIRNTGNAISILDLISCHEEKKIKGVKLGSS